MGGPETAPRGRMLVACLDRLPGRVALCLTLAGSFAVIPARAADPSTASSLERQVKIAFLYNFAKFVEWPDGSLTGPHAPLTVGVLGSDTFCLDLEQGLEGRTVDAHPIVVRRLAGLEEARTVQILFIGSALGSRVDRAFVALRGAPVLTVGDMPRFAARGGIINFTIEDNKVRFEINVDAARRAGLKISSKLLNVATVLRDTAHAGF
jgi:hypothetical protein